MKRSLFCSLLPGPGWPSSLLGWIRLLLGRVGPSGHGSGYRWSLTLIYSVCPKGSCLIRNGTSSQPSGKQHCFVWSIQFALLFHKFDSTSISLGYWARQMHRGPRSQQPRSPDPAHLCYIYMSCVSLIWLHLHRLPSCHLTCGLGYFLDATDAGQPIFLTHVWWKYDVDSYIQLPCCCMMARMWWHVVYFVAMLELANFIFDVSVARTIRKNARHFRNWIIYWIA